MTLKEEIEEILHPEKRLHPPMPPTPIVGEIELPKRENGLDHTHGTSGGNIPNDSKPTIDFSYLANNSSFQRAIIEFIKKFVPGFENVDHRGSKEVMVKSFNKNAHNYQNVMKEFKSKLEGLRKRNES